ncbi:MAG: response regulator, partial [Epsilonproteobacteria bacterium]|nr:response regulator [Campylobacterota bacterium]
VDDVEDNRELIVKNFEDTNIEVVTADNGLKAIEVFKKEQPDLVLMDIRMPVMDGYEAAVEIKKISDVSIVALTASVMTTDYEKSKRRYFDGFLRKPVMHKDLFNELQKFLACQEVEIDSSEEQIVLSEKTKLNRDVISTELLNRVNELHKKAVSTNSMADIKLLAQNILTLAEQYEVDFLSNYANKLLEAVDAFDILTIQGLMREYEGLNVTLMDS